MELQLLLSPFQITTAHLQAKGLHIMHQALFMVLPGNHLMTPHHPTTVLQVSHLIFLLNLVIIPLNQAMGPQSQVTTYLATVLPNHLMISFPQVMVHLSHHIMLPHPITGLLRQSASLRITHQNPLIMLQSLVIIHQYPVMGHH